MLTLRAKWFLRGGLLNDDRNSKPFMFDVLGLPEGQEMEIGEHRREWRTRRRWGKWSDKRFGTPEQALASLTV